MKKYSKSIPLKKRLKYNFERTLTKGTIAIIFWLAFLTLITAVFFGFILVIFQVTPRENDKNFSFVEAFWQSFLHSIDTGAIQADTNWNYRIIAIIVTLIGVLIFSALTGILTNGLERAFQRMRKGKSEIFEENFILILGWNHSIFKVISELVIGYSHHKDTHIIILSEKDKVEMEDEIIQRVKQKQLLKKTYRSEDKRKFFHIHKPKHIICRRGNPLDINDLEFVHPEKAKTIIIIPTNYGKEADMFVIKTILALDYFKIKCPVICEVKIKSNRKTLLNWNINNPENNSGNKVYIPSRDWLAKITTQTSRQSGYSTVLTEILNFYNNEIYIQNPEYNSPFLGKFEDALFNCENGILLGIEKIEKKEIILNPLQYAENDKRRIIEKNDKIIVLKYDENPVKFLNHSENFEFINYKIEKNRKKEKILILGWNIRIQIIIKELYGYIAENSEIKIMADVENLERKLEILINELKEEIDFKAYNFKIELIKNEKSELIDKFKCDTSDFNLLNKLQLTEFDSILVLGNQSIEIQEKDAKTILTLLHITEIFNNSGKEKHLKPNIIAEIYDEKNHKTIEITHTCDFIISNNIISSAMAQICYEKDLFKILDKLFSYRGCEIYLKDIKKYKGIEIGKPINFYKVMLEAANKKQIAIGYRKNDEVNLHDKNFGVYLNPSKNDEITFTSNDNIIVLSGNE